MKLSSHSYFVFTGGYRGFISTLLVTVFVSSNLTSILAQAYEVPENLAWQKENIMSEGTRMGAEVFSLKSLASEKLPTIIMSHGWGGKAESLRRDAVVFADAGFLVVIFDYRGWGNSDSRVVLVGERPNTNEDKFKAEVREVREVVDPIDQTTDILNAIHWAASHPQCDVDRIGLWGSSFSGGHVVYVAARDPRVKAFVSQVGSLYARWTITMPEMKEQTLQMGADRTRGNLDYPKPGEKWATFTGVPILEKFMHYAPIEDIDRCEDVAKLFILAENEELFDNAEHGILAHERAKGVKKLAIVEGIKHYGIYYDKRQEAQQLALDWYNTHLK